LDYFLHFFSTFWLRDIVGHVAVRPGIYGVLYIHIYIFISPFRQHKAHRRTSRHAYTM